MRALRSLPRVILRYPYESLILHFVSSYRDHKDVSVANLEIKGLSDCPALFGEQPWWNLYKQITRPVPRVNAYTLPSVRFCHVYTLRPFKIGSAMQSSYPME